MPQIKMEILWYISHLEDKTIINTHVANIRASIYIKEKLTEGKKLQDLITVIVGNVNVPILIMDRTTKH